jgi:uncharacterized protein
MSYWCDKVVLVTGASGGLGRHIAAAFVQAGASIVMAARDRSRLESAAAELQTALNSATNYRVLAVPADVTVQDDVERLIAQVTGEFGRLDGLVNCVGVSNRGRAIDTTPEEFAQAMELNFLSAVRMTRAAMPYLLRSRGHLVNIGSLAGKTASRYLGAYPASKFALSAYTQQVRLELAPDGVKVLLVLPGPIAREDAGARYAEQAADLPASAGQPGAGVRLAGIDPAALARRILSACKQGRAELVVPGRARLLFAISQLWPSLGDWILRKMT